MGHPFHGQCSIAICCQDKGFSHCGECGGIPCPDLYRYSYLDPEHGDKPPGTRVANCRQWAKEAGIHRWERVLLTSAAFATPDGRENSKLKQKFLELLGKLPEDARVLFVPTAAITDGAKYYAGLCKEELLEMGFKEANIVEHELDGSLTEAEAMEFDILYIPGGNTRHLLNRIKETGFDRIIKKMVYANKVYVGVSAGSLIATPNIDKDDPLNPESAGLALVHAYLSVHCTDETQLTDLPLPHIALTDRQALWVTYSGFGIIEG